MNTLNNDQSASGMKKTQKNTKTNKIVTTYNSLTNHYIHIFQIKDLILTILISCNMHIHNCMNVSTNMESSIT